MSFAVETPNAVAPDIRRVYSYEELVAEMPETNQPCELWDGELLMSPAPSFYHQEIVFRFHRALHDWVVPRQLGKLVGVPIDMVLSPRRVTQPDVVFIAASRLGIIKHVILGPADLVVEVVSLGGRNRDRIEKRDLYEQYGIKEYWIIDPEAESVDVLALANNRFELAMRCAVGGTASSRLLNGFAIPVDSLFRGP